MAATISLFAVDLDRLTEAWRARPIEALLAASPRGSLAALFERPLGVTVDRRQPPARALAGAPPADQRDAFDALVEDLARAAVWDADEARCGEVFAALARVAKEPALAFDGALLPSAAVVYPPDLTEDPFVDHIEARAGMVVLLPDPAKIAAAGAAAARALELPAGAFPTEEPTLFHDLLEAVAELLAACARPGSAVVAQRAQS